MTKRIRFHLDENAPPAIAQALRRHGIDMSTTVEAGLRTQSDAAQLEFVRREQRVIITRDVDFLRLAQQSTDHFGIAFCPPHRSLGELIRSLILIYELLTPEEMAGRVEYL